MNEEATKPAPSDVEEPSQLPISLLIDRLVKCTNSLHTSQKLMKRLQRVIEDEGGDNFPNCVVVIRFLEDHQNPEELPVDGKNIPASQRQMTFGPVFNAAALTLQEESRKVAAYGEALKRKIEEQVQKANL